MAHEHLANSDLIAELESLGTQIRWAQEWFLWWHGYLPEMQKRPINTRNYF